RGLLEAGANKIQVVVGHGGDEVKAALGERFGNSCPLSFVTQSKQLGTAHAVGCAQLHDDDGPIVICNGDHPLITSQNLADLVEGFNADTPDFLMTSVQLDHPTGFGRILRSEKGDLIGIVEEKDASPVQKKITEVNPGLYVTTANVLKEFLPKIKNH